MKIEEIQKMLDLMNEHDLTEIEVEDEHGKIRLKKGSAEQKEIIGIPQMNGISIPPVAGETAAEVQNAPQGEMLTSPLVGTFYRRANPESEPYVKVGDHVEEDTVVGVVEAMKVMNEIKAEKSGVIKKILVKNAHPVEYMQPIFELEP